MSELVRISTKPSAPTFLARARATFMAVRAAWSGPYSLKDPALSKLFGAGYESSSGIVVTPENAYTFSAVFSAVLQISSDVAKLPLNLHKRRKEGGSDHYIDSKLYHLLKSEPNPESSSMMFRQTLTAHALTCHGGYAEIERDLHGRPAALWILTPDRVEPFRREQFERATGRKTLGPLEYRIDNDDDQILPARDVIHVSGLGYDGITGYSVINKARQAIGLALAMEKFGGQYFGKGTVFGGWLETDADLDEDQKKDIKDNIEAFRKAQDSAWRILVTGTGHKFHQFASKPSESQMDESRTAQVLEVARFFRMPPVKLGVNTPGAVSYASSEQADLDYYKGPMLDWITREEQEFNRKLIPAPERRQQFIKHNASAFLRADTKGRTEFYGSMLDRGVFNADDVLELEDLNPQPGGVGKMYLVQGAQVPKDQLKAVIDAKIKKDSTPKPAPVAPAPAGSGESDAVREVLTSVTATMSTLGERVAVMAEQQRSLDVVTADLAAERVTMAECNAALAAANDAVMQRESDRDEAIARAEMLAIAAADATTARETHAADAAQARQEVAALVQRADAAIVAQQDAAASAEAAEERQTALTEERNAIATELEATRTTVADLESQLTAEQAAAAILATERAAHAIAAAEALASMQDARDQASTEVNEIRSQLQSLEVAHAANLVERDAAIDAMRSQLAAAETLRAEAATALDEMQSGRDQLAAEAETLRTQLSTTEASHAAIVGESQQSIEELRTNLRAAEALLAETDEERVSRLSDLTATADRLTGELAAAEVRAEAERVAHASAVAPVQAALEASEQVQASLQSRVVELESRVAETEGIALRAQQHLEGERASRIERMTATIAAHRGLIADVLGRMTRRQAQQARAKQATPEKLRRWLASVVSVEAPICHEALLPSIRVRLAAKGSTEDPVRVTTALVAEHLSAFESLMRGVLDEPVEDFHAELERVLVRWETERPATVADALLEEEVRHVRAL